MKINAHNSSSETKTQRISLGVWLIALVPAVIALTERIFNLDIIWFRAINQTTAILPDHFWTNLSLLGNGWACFALAFPLIIIAPRILYAGLFAGLFTSLLAKPVKLIFNTPRPAGLLDPNSFHIIGEHLHQAAMPSGHTTTAFAIFTAIYLSINPQIRSKYSWIFIFPILTAISRIAVGAHWPEDVLVGTTLGIFSGILGTTLSRKLNEKNIILGSFPSLIIILGSFICTHILLTTSLDFEINELTQYALVFIILGTWVAIIKKIKFNKNV